MQLDAVQRGNRRLHDFPAVAQAHIFSPGLPARSRVAGPEGSASYLFPESGLIPAEDVIIQPTCRTLIRILEMCWPPLALRSDCTGDGQEDHRIRRSNTLTHGHP